MPERLDNDLQKRLIDLVRSDASLMQALAAARELGLDSWCIGAGAVRSLVWDRLHGYSKRTALDDVDLTYFDANESPESAAALSSKIAALLPQVRWELTNQASVHNWFKSIGQDVPALESLEAGIATWPEIATCVGVSLRRDDSIQVIAPHGLEDLFEMRVKHNPARVDAKTYNDRVEKKRFAEKWPKLEILPAVGEV